MKLLWKSLFLDFKQVIAYMEFEMVMTTFIYNLALRSLQMEIVWSYAKLNKYSIAEQLVLKTNIWLYLPGFERCCAMVCLLSILNLPYSLSERFYRTPDLI